MADSTLTVTLSTQVYKEVLANVMLGVNPAMDWHPVKQGGEEIFLGTLCYRNWRVTGLMGHWLIILVHLSSILFINIISAYYMDLIILIIINEIILGLLLRDLG